MEQERDIYIWEILSGLVRVLPVLPYRYHALEILVTITFYRALPRVEPSRKSGGKTTVDPSESSTTRGTGDIDPLDGTLPQIPEYQLFTTRRGRTGRVLVEC